MMQQRILRISTDNIMRRPVICLLGTHTKKTEQVLSETFTVFRHPVLGADLVASRFEYNPVGSIYRSFAPFTKQICPIKWIDASNITLTDARRFNLISWVDFKHVYFDGDIEKDVALALSCN